MGGERPAHPDEHGRERRRQVAIRAEYNGVPGPEARNFKKNCTQKLGQQDKFGYSIADCLMRIDMGAVMHAVMRRGRRAAHWAASVHAAGLHV